MGKNELSGVAYSYMRFSSPRQERGDSIKRQTEARDNWLKRNPGVVAAADGDYRELGTSSFRGKHRLDDKTALKQFITAVESGRVKPGSILIVESFDRLTREEFGEAAEFVLGLVNRGVRIVQLSPVEVILEKPVDLTKALILVVELTRGHGESQRKSDTIGSAWRGKREACRESGAIVTKGAKAWLKLKDGKFVFKLGAKALIRRIFKMATTGHGCRSIAQILNREKVSTWTKGEWYEMYIRVMLRGREVLGEYRQARRNADGKREFEGEPVLGYYPAALTEGEWQAAQVAGKARDTRGGRPAKQGQFINLFQGIIKDARTGDSVHINSHTAGVRLLIPAGFKRRGEATPSFPLEPFDRAILSKLSELDPREVIGDGQEGPDEVAELRAKLTRLDVQIKALVEQFDGDNVPEVAEKVRHKNAERKTLTEDYERAKANAASPLSSAWGECKGLVEALDTAKDVREMRLRLRQAIARIIESVTCLFAGTRSVRLAAVRVQFAGGRHRDYFIEVVQRYKGHAPNPPRISTAVWGSGGSEIDLRNRQDAAEVAEELAALDLS